MKGFRIGIRLVLVITAGSLLLIFFNRTTPPKKPPIPLTPRIAGVISGLERSEDLVFIYVYDGGEQLGTFGTIPENGNWEMVILEQSEDRQAYRIVAEAEGYISRPNYYDIWIENETAYVVHGNREEEALNLEFRFVAKEAP